MALSDYLPTVDDLGAIMRARTVDEDGEELGTFTQNTRPTESEVERVALQAQALVAVRLGAVPAEKYDVARVIVALRAAMLLEVAYWPQEARADDSAYAAYRQMYLDAMGDYFGVTPDGEVVVTPPSRRAGSLRVATVLTSPDLYPR